MWDVMKRDSGSLFHVEPPRKDTGMKDSVLIHGMAGKQRWAIIGQGTLVFHEDFHMAAFTFLALWASVPRRQVPM